MQRVRPPACPLVDFAPALALDVAGVQRRLEAGNGGYEIVHASPGLEVGVYVLVAPEPDRCSPTRTTSSTATRGRRTAAG